MWKGAIPCSLTKTDTQALGARTGRDRDAEGVLFESVGEDSAMFIAGPEGSTTIHRGQTRRLPVMFTFGGSGDPVLRIQWVEDDDAKHRDFHVG